MALKETVTRFGFLAVGALLMFILISLPQAVLESGYKVLLGLFIIVMTDLLAHMLTATEDGSGGRVFAHIATYIVGGIFASIYMYCRPLSVGEAVVTVVLGLAISLALDIQRAALAKKQRELAAQGICAAN